MANHKNHMKINVGERASANRMMMLMHKHSKEILEQGRAAVVQLAEQSLPLPEDPGLNTAIGNFYWTSLLLTVCRKDENIRKNMLGMAHILINIEE